MLVFLGTDRHFYAQIDRFIMEHYAVLWPDRDADGAQIEAIQIETYGHQKCL